MSPLWKAALEAGPLLLFFGAYYLGDIYWATGAAIFASLVAVAAYWFKIGRVPAAPLITFLVVGVFGGITLALQDPDFVKMKPTAVYLLFAAALFGGLSTGRLFLKGVFGEVFSLTDRGWRVLTIRWGLFFLTMAVLNEVVWRSFSEGAWVNFKVWAILPLTMIFAGAQYPVLKRYGIEPDPDKAP
ncbi:septation protein A [Neomegalonema sp.]|uniref:septation protein A n=1 Tax=Neomegalonema sp. TaxID=2039713 RepID=UPI00261F3DEC|nr:septation protein A [Neomegalonema sp.]MDD2869855.1 septation protein A [Neomegalonema sp.]